MSRFSFRSHILFACCRCHAFLLLKGDRKHAVDPDTEWQFSMDRTQEEGMQQQQEKTKEEKDTRRRAANG